jgi:antirestriction protein ArdC
VLILGMDLRAFETGAPRWMAYQQAQEKRWQVRKGEKSTGIFFFKPLEVGDKDIEGGEDGPASRMVAVLRSYSGFHASQIDGVPPYIAPTLEEAP